MEPLTLEEQLRAKMAETLGYESDFRVEVMDDENPPRRVLLDAENDNVPTLEELVVYNPKTVAFALKFLVNKIQ